MRIQWRYQPCPCLLAGGLASIWEAVSPLFSNFLVTRIGTGIASGGPALKHYWFNASCLAIIGLEQCWVSVSVRQC